MSISHSGEHTYISLLRAYRADKITFTPKQEKIFKAILKGREARVLASKSELSEALFCALVAADDDLETELRWWSPK